MDFPRCGTCRWWEPNRQEGGGAEWRGEGQGDCLLTVSMSTEAKHSDSLAVAQDSEGYYAVLVTHKDFGCVQHKPVRPGDTDEPVVAETGEKPMARVKFLKDTVHPDYGEVKKGEVLAVPQEYLRDYEAAGIAQECDDDVTREEPEGASQWEVHASAVEARRRAVGGEQPGGRSRGR